uniref:ABC-F family ATP-binding cassette domain-containing protein n=1 Tax=Propioniciclava sp. TaxID=2038686 RepID=UPI002625C9E7
VNAERISKAYGTRTLLDEVSLGLAAGEVVGVVGRNGDGKSTLLGILVGTVEPDAGQVIRAAPASIGHLAQTEEFAPAASVRDVIVGGQPDHVWAADALSRTVVEHLLADIPLDAETGTLSGGERRRVALVALMLGHHDLIVLDEPTNHLDVEAVAWLAAHLAELRDRGVAIAIVSHDRWFLDAVCTRVWEVHDAQVDAYDGGYAAWVLARVERQRQAAATEARRQNLARKELAWLRRGAPARTSKPRFRIEAANALIADVPAPRDKLQLQQFAVTRLGKDVFDLHGVSVRVPAADDERTLFGPLDWSIGPGDRIGLVGVNGSGKSTLLRVLAHEQAPTTGRVRQGKTLRLGHLSQALDAAGPGALDPRDRVLDSVQQLVRETRLATGRDITATQLLADFGFTGDRLTTRVGDLSGGERRRLAFLR